MQQFDPTQMTDAQLEELLRKSFLKQDSTDSPNEIHNDMTSSDIFSKKFDVSIDPAKEKELLRKLSASIKPKSNLKYFYLSLVLISGLFLFYFLAKGPLTSHTKSSVDEQLNPIEPPPNSLGNTVATLDSAADNSKITEEHFDELTFSNTETQEAEMKEPVILTDGKYEERVEEFKRMEADSPIRLMPISILEKKTEAKIPVLTAYEIKRNDKQKSEMLRNLIKKTKNEYSLVPAGKLSYKGRKYDIGNFAIRNSEVSNLEYKTFLIDLIVQGRMEEFRTANVNSMGWNKIGLTEYGADYFQAEKFNRHPVVNISKEGALLYCKWLFDEVALYVAEHGYGKLKIKEIRMPSELEWAYAAKGGIDSSVYCNGLSVVVNKNECALGNYRRIGSTDLRMMEKKNIKVDTSKYILGRYKYCFDEKDFDKRHKSNDNLLDYTVSIYSFNPNGYGIYGMAGNVSELVSVADGNGLRTIGGNWNSKEYYLKIESADEFAGRTESSPFVGFRPLLLFDYVKVASEKTTPFW